MAETLKVYMARVFSAIDVECEKLKDELERVRNRLDLGFKPVSKHRMHVTLQFFRDVDKEDIAALKEAMDDIEKDSFSAKVEGVGCFPSLDHIRVVWSGFENEDPIRELYTRLSQHSVEPDNTHRFKPHITLIRVKDINS
jgi:2'-5' RNA ligase